MGQTITQLVSEMEDVAIVCGFDISENAHAPYPVYAFPDAYTGPADVIIDFSHPSAFSSLTAYAKRRKIPLVMCTTGLSTQQTESLTELSKEIPVFFSANMSLGINLLIELVQKAATLLYGSFDIEIVERHHNQKIDAPSGTALAIADAISQVLPDEMEYVYDRHSVRKKRSKKEIGLHAVRGGTIVGDHQVIFAGNDEVLEINHHAASKGVFAAGSIKAAQFLKSQPVGMYNMRDLVKTM